MKTYLHFREDWTTLTMKLILSYTVFLVLQVHADRFVTLHICHKWTDSLAVFSNIRIEIQIVTHVAGSLLESGKIKDEY